MRTRPGKEALKRRQTTALENIRDHIKAAHADGKKDEPHNVGKKGTMDLHKKEMKILTAKLNIQIANPEVV
jgi:hypothetical protein